jgi:hypothetical protein
MFRSTPLSRGRSSPRRPLPLAVPRSLAPVLAAAAALLAAGPAAAATFYELNKPVFLGTGETSWIGKGGPCVRGQIDVASGYYSFEWPLVTLRGRHPFSLVMSV